LTSFLESEMFNGELVAVEVYGAEELLLMIPEPDRPSPEDYYDGQADAMQTYEPRSI